MRKLYNDFATLLKICDALSIIIAFLAIIFFGHFTKPFDELFFIAVFLLIAWFSVSWFTQLYANAFTKEAQKHFGELAKTFFIFTALNFSILYFFPTLNFGRNSAFWSVVIFAFIIGLARIAALLYRKNYRVYLNRKLSSVLVGRNVDIEEFLQNKSFRQGLGVKGFYTVTEGVGIKKGKYLGTLDDLLRDLNGEKIDNIIICDSGDVEEIYRPILKKAENQMVRIFFLPGFSSFLPATSLKVVGDVPLFKLMPEPLQIPEKAFVKRAFDILFSLFVIIFILSWLTPIIAIIIRAESKGPVFFTQLRSGLDNKPFNCIKFRSMTINKDADLKVATKNDRRVTNFGAFMRKTSIDELPQFFNVLVGDMSVVGPRPHMLSQTEIYSEITDRYMLRHMVKPGITGWAQVTGARGEIFSEKDMQRRVEKDVWYIQNWSFFLDLKIIFLTVYNIFRGDEQAY
ncbi:exopolysaccharide biosynthesis polyprenyl glycosylphosphotransferase [Cruoricaptor ignavus]|nr:exopolysaccharide biosynthesis polyprenyl glycosylphosphotransferase [Cruoricaptor ignavus]